MGNGDRKETAETKLRDGVAIMEGRGGLLVVVDLSML